MDSKYSGDTYSFSWDGDSLTCNYDGDMLMFHRTSKSVPGSKKPASGTYQVSAAFQGNDSAMSDFWGTTLVVNSDGSATITIDYETLPLTWDEHFFYDVEAGDPVFYEYDGKTLILTNGDTRIEFTRG
jgi:hypothetical protein